MRILRTNKMQLFRLFSLNHLTLQQMVVHQQTVRRVVSVNIHSTVLQLRKTSLFSILVTTHPVVVL